MTRIFVDTNILFDDPFFQFNNKYILDLAKQNDKEIIISEIVIKETSDILKARLKDIIHNYKVNQNKLKKLTKLPISSIPLERSKIVDDFNNFIQDLKNRNLVKILPLNTEILELSLKDLLDKKPPFFNGKNELKDSLIWHTYAIYDKIEAHDKCIILSNNIRDFANSDGRIHNLLYSINNNFRLIRNIIDLKLELGEITNLTNVQESTNSLSELKIKDLFQVKQSEILIEHLNHAVSEYYQFRAFRNILDTNRKFLQIANLDIISLTSIRDYDNNEIQNFIGTIKAELKLEIYEICHKKIFTGSRIQLADVLKIPFLFDYEVILNSHDHIEFLDISNLAEIRDSSWDNDVDLPF